MVKFTCDINFTFYNHLGKVCIFIIFGKGTDSLFTLLKVVKFVSQHSESCIFTVRGSKLRTFCLRRKLLFEEEMK